MDVLIPEQGESAEAVLERSFSPPHFPIVPAQLGAGWSFRGLAEGRHRVEGYDVLAREIPHKGGRTFGYRVEADGATVAYLSDHSPTSVGPGPDGLGERHEALLDLVSGADVLIHDAQHRAEQFPEVGFLGHASPEFCVAAAREAGVHTLVLHHHAPTRTDDEVDAILEHARTLAAGDVTRPRGVRGAGARPAPPGPRDPREFRACRSSAAAVATRARTGPSSAWSAGRRSPAPVPRAGTPWPAASSAWSAAPR